MNNNRNKMIYKLWSGMYDYFFNRGSFLKARKNVFQDYPFKKGQRILFVGVGTGADLELINLEGLEITGIDLSKDMLEKARSKFKGNVTLKEMDALNLEFPDSSFDVIVSSLIISVVPDPVKAINEMNRVLRTNGEIVIFDKFSDGKRTSKFVRKMISLLGTDIGLKFTEVLNKSNKSLKIVENQSVMLNGMYRKIILQKEC